MFQLTGDEFEILRSQTVTSRWGGRRFRPYAFTEQGVAMLSSVLRSTKAIRVNIEIMRSFVHLRRMLERHDDLARRLTAFESKYDKQFKIVFDAIRQLMASEKDTPQERIGFHSKKSSSSPGKGSKTGRTRKPKVPKS